MTCPDDDQVAAFVDGTLAADARAAIESHVDRCADCRVAIGHLAALGDGDRGGDRANIGRYRLEQPIGAGGMGVVWAAWDPQLERRVAVKLLRTTAGVARERLIREARALARLQHPNVVAVHDAGLADGEVFIATELVDGESLATWSRGRAWRDIASAYAQAARGLAAAHDAGLVHRDVKPANLLAGRDGRIRVGDFGLALAADAAPIDERTTAPIDERTTAPIGASPVPGSSPRLTDHGHVVGTPAYMAPEQLGGAAPDPRSDQYVGSPGTELEFAL